MKDSKKTRPAMLGKGKNRNQIDNIPDTDLDQNIQITIDLDSEDETKATKISVLTDTPTNFNQPKITKSRRKSFASDTGSSSKEIKKYESAKFKIRKKSIDEKIVFEGSEPEIKKINLENKTQINKNFPETIADQAKPISPEDFPDFPENNEEFRNAVTRNFEEVMIKKEFDDEIKIIDKNNIEDSKDKVKNESGDPLAIEASYESQQLSQSFVLNKTTSPLSPGPSSNTNRVFIIKNLAGKSVTLRPKTIPVVIHKDITVKPVASKNKNTDNSENKNSAEKNKIINNKIINNLSEVLNKNIEVGKNKTVISNKTLNKKINLKNSQNIIDTTKPAVLNKSTDNIKQVVLNKPQENIKINPGKNSDPTNNIINKPVILNKSTENKNTSVIIKQYDSKSVVPQPSSPSTHITKTLKTLKTIKPIQRAVFNPKPEIQKLPNCVMKISDVNKSQKYFNPFENKIDNTKKYIRPKFLENIDLTDEKEMNDNDEKKMSNFSTFLQALTDTSTENINNSKKIEEIKIPIYVDRETQTDIFKIFREQGVQTDVISPSPVPSEDSLPNITNLLEYVLNTPKYSTGLDEIKKNDLIDMSKNIVMKGKNYSPIPKGEDSLKKQLFMDLKDCATFDFLGNKPIHNAVLENNIALLKRQIFALRLRKIDLDVENNQGQTALQLAVFNNCHVEIISTLLLNGSSVNILDNEGNNLIHLAVINSTHVVLELLIKYLVDPIKEINRKNDEGLTPLMIAAIDSKPELVDVLLRNQADPNLRDEKSGRTALFHAVELNCNFVINLLLKYKGDPKVRNYFGLTALDAAKDLDIQDSKILENSDSSSPNSTVQNNQPSVIVNLQKSATIIERQASPVPQPAKRQYVAKIQNGDQAKKSKISFISTFKKVELDDVKSSTNSPFKPRRRRQAKK